MGKTPRKTTEDFIREGTLIHNGYYNYPNSVYKGAREMIEVECPVHGAFNVRAGNHTIGVRCRKCNEGNSLGIFTRSTALKNKREWSQIPGLVYFLKLEDGDEVFFKVGVTYNLDINNRLKEFPKSYNIEVLLLDESNLYNSVISECNVKEDMQSFKYKPNKDFRGKEECFSENPLEYYYYYFQNKNQEEYEYKN